MLRQLTERGGEGGRHRPGRARTPVSPFHVKRAETSAPVDSAAGPHSRSRGTAARCTRVDGCRRSSACTAAHVVSDRRIPGSAWRPRAQVSHLWSRVIRVPGRGSGWPLPRVPRRQGRWGRGRTGQPLRSTRWALASAGGWGVDARGTAARSDPGKGASGWRAPECEHVGVPGRRGRVATSTPACWWRGPRRVVRAVAVVLQSLRRDVAGTGASRMPLPAACPRAARRSVERVARAPMPELSTAPRSPVDSFRPLARTPREESSSASRAWVVPRQLSAGAENWHSVGCAAGWSSRVGRGGPSVPGPLVRRDCGQDEVMHRGCTSQDAGTADVCRAGNRRRELAVPAGCSRRTERGGVAVMSVSRETPRARLHWPTRPIR